MTPDHNDEGDWTGTLAWILVVCCASPIVWMLGKALWLKGN